MKEMTTTQMSLRLRPSDVAKIEQLATQLMCTKTEVMLRALSLLNEIETLRGKDEVVIIAREDAVIESRIGRVVAQ